jgi:membrane protein implicated in regulation of membrane protease activity
MNRPVTGSRLWYLLLLVPIVGLLWVPLYASKTPELFGFPFFYWYQLAWVPISVAITWFVYTRTRTRGVPPGGDNRTGPAPFEPGPGHTPTRTPVGGERA